MQVLQQVFLLSPGARSILHRRGLLWPEMCVLPMPADLENICPRVHSDVWIHSDALEPEVDLIW